MEDSPGLAAARDRPSIDTVMASGLDPERWQRVKSLLDEALDLSPDRRPAFLESACAGDEALLREVKSLAEAAEGAWSFVDRSAHPGLNALEKDDAPSRIGQRIGTYEVVRELARRNGDGLSRAAPTGVQLAAIKLIRPGTRQALAVSVSAANARSRLSITPASPGSRRRDDRDGEPYFVMGSWKGSPALATTATGICLGRSAALQRGIVPQSTCTAASFVHPSSRATFW